MNRLLPRTWAALTILLLSACALTGEESVSKTKAKALFTADAYLAHVKYLASDELAGRAPASEGSEQAAQYIIKHLKQAGCEPGGEDGSWF